MNHHVSSLDSGANPFQTVLRKGANSGIWWAALGHRIFTIASIDLKRVRRDSEGGLPLWIWNIILQKVINFHVSSMISDANQFQTG